MDNKLNEWGSLFECAWEGSTERKGIIFGKWAEDGNEYEISVPPQLRTTIIDMQNWLYRWYRKIEALKIQINIINNKFEE